MAELKTRPNRKSPRRFIESLENQRRRGDGLQLLDLFGCATRQEPVMWGDSIVGYGEYRYQTDSGWSGAWMMTGFSPRKQSMVVYIMPGFSSYESLLTELGKHRLGKSCLYINKLADVDMDVLQTLVSLGYQRMAQLYDCS